MQKNMNQWRHVDLRQQRRGARALVRDTLTGKYRIWEYLRKNGDGLLVTQYGVHLWTSYPNKNVVQLLVWMFDVPIYTTILYGTKEDIPCSRSPWSYDLYRIVSRRFAKKLKYIIEKRAERGASGNAACYVGCHCFLMQYLL